MSETHNSESSLPTEPRPTILKGVPVAGQAEKLVKVRREITRADEMTRFEQIEHEAKLKAEKVLGDARSEAEKILAQARSEAEGIRVKAREEGDLSAKREALEKLAGLISNMEQEIRSLKATRTDFLDANLRGIIDFSCALAGKILVTELQSRPEVIAERTRTLIERFPPESKVMLTVSSQDLEVIESFLHEAGGPSDTLRPALRSDPELETGCFTIECDTGCIEAGFLNALAEMGNILGDLADHVSDFVPPDREEWNDG